jgi:DNA-binding MarR family transcriptional regulator
MSKRTPEGDAFSMVAAKVLFLNNQISEMGGAIAGSADQSSARWRVLAVTDMKLITVAQIARALGLARQSVQRLADLLTEEGLTAFKENPTDKRAMHLVPTAKGKRTLAEIQTEQRKWSDRMGADLGMKSLREIDMALRELMSAFKNK